MNWLVEANACPGLFYGTAAQDGFLIRLRTPGGWLNSPQGKAIATWLEQWQTTIQVTNRANLQIRGLQKSPSLEDFQTLQKLGLAAHNPSIDHLRNIMSSPTAGIDCQELIDTRPLVQELDNFIQNYPSIAQLSPKFSIGILGANLLDQPQPVNQNAVLTSRHFLPQMYGHLAKTLTGRDSTQQMSASYWLKLDVLKFAGCLSA